MIRVLGEVRVSNGKPVEPGQDLPLERKARELLTAIVLYSPAALGVPELTRLLWDEAPDSALRTLRSHLSRIRSAVRSAGQPDPINSARGETYRLASELETDLAVVMRLRRGARALLAENQFDAAARELGAAREWWIGSPRLPATIAGQALLVGWERERRLLVSEHLEAVVRGSRPEDALGELARLTAADPLDEHTWVQYVTGLHRAGRQVEALEAVARARECLTEVGLDPGPALRAAQAAVLAGPDPKKPQVRPPGELRLQVTYTEGGETAYTRLTHGSPTVVVLNPAMITIDGLLEEPHVRDALARLGAHLGLICLDRRGIGLSAPLESATSPLEQWVADVAAVVQHAGLRRPVLLANFDTGLVALEYAARYPDGLAGLVLVNCYATYRRSVDYPHGLDADTTAHLIEAAVDPSRARPLDTSILVAPSLASDEAFRAWWDRIGRRGANPTTARIVREVATTTDLRHRLPGVTCPVLLIPLRQCTNVDPGRSRYLAERLPRAQLAPIDGVDGVWFTEGEEVAGRVVAFASTHGA